MTKADKQERTARNMDMVKLCCAGSHSLTFSMLIAFLLSRYLHTCMCRLLLRLPKLRRNRRVRSRNNAARKARSLKVPPRMSRKSVANAPRPRGRRIGTLTLLCLSWMRPAYLSCALRCSALSCRITKSPRFSPRLRLQERRTQEEAEVLEEHETHAAGFEDTPASAQYNTTYYRYGCQTGQQPTNHSPGIYEFQKLTKLKSGNDWSAHQGQVCMRGEEKFLVYSVIGAHLPNKKAVRKLVGFPGECDAWGSITDVAAKSISQSTHTWEMLSSDQISAGDHHAAATAIVAGATCIHFACARQRASPGHQ